MIWIVKVLKEEQMNLLTVHDVTERLGVHRITAYRMLKRGELPRIKVGGAWRFEPRDIDAYLARNRKSN